MVINRGTTPLMIGTPLASIVNMDTYVGSGRLACHSGGQPVTLALPCIGIDACSQALVDIKVPFLVRCAYDVQACLARPLTALHGDISDFRLGQIEGDLLAADVHAWERVDRVVAGHGCQTMVKLRQTWQLDGHSGKGVLEGQ